MQTDPSLVARLIPDWFRIKMEAQERQDKLTADQQMQGV